MEKEDYKLYQKYARKMLRGDISEEERSALMNWLQNNNDKSLFIPFDIASNKEEHGEKIYKKISAQIFQSKSRSLVRRISVAAMITLVLGLGIILIYNSNKVDRHRVMAIKKEVDSDTTFLTPGGNKATLILSNGKQLALNNCQNGNIADDEGVKINKDRDGSLSYNSQKIDAKPMTNILQTPVGGQYQLTLPDGTKVWLNSKSTIQYPTAFIGEERRVVMSGEAYFEVAHDASKPFHVEIKGLDIQVLGTHFNVNGYEDDGNIKASLIEGAITAKSMHGSVNVQPEQQCILDRNGALTLQKNINVNEVLAWKNGGFEFGQDADIHTVMKQLARWYDFEIEYENPHMNARVAGGISRNVSGYEALKMLEQTGSIRFKVNGNKVTVLPP